MKLVVLGASGGCGRELVKQARARGHAVVSVGRASSTLDEGTGIEVRRGDVTDAAFLERCFEGADAVLSALGLNISSMAPWAKPEVPDLLSRAGPAIVAAATAAGVSRVIAISAGGVGDSYERVPGFFQTLIRWSALRHPYAELEVFERALLASDLEVLLPRPTGLTHEPATGAVIEADRFVGRATIPRADVAGYMLDAVEREPMPTGAPLITVTGAA